MFLFAILSLLIGATLTAGGVYLLTLSGSPYYVIAGILLLYSGWLGLTKNERVRPVFAVFLILTAIWSVYESGLDWWPLATRLGLFLGLGILLFWKIGYCTGKNFYLATWAMITIALLGTIWVPTHNLDGELNQTIVSDSPRIGQVPDDSWYAYGRSNLGQRYSPLTQINLENVKTLKQAWVYQTGDRKGPKDVTETTYEVTPLKIGNALYICTPHNWLVALDADTGHKLWQYDAKVPPESQRQHQTCRGVSYLPPKSGEIPMAKLMNKPSEELAPVQCDAQIFMPTSDARLLAFDPATGALCDNFANHGQLDLLHNMPFKQAGYYYSTSPPVVANGVIVVAGSVNDNYDVNEPTGVIRAYDVKTGQIVWNWDAGNPEQTEPLGPDETYRESSPNSWSVSSADPVLGLIYIPMGNRTPDQLGMYRSKNDEKYASSVVALHLDTGKVAWVQQFVHHDLWDMDTPAQPALIDLDTKQGLQPALVVPTKQGDIYVLNRQTGKPIFPITEQEAPQGTIEGDFTSKTQPISAVNQRPKPLTESDMWGATPIDQMICRIQFRLLRYEGQYTPPSEQGTIVYPGNFGVFNWGSIAVDPKRQVMFSMPLYLAFTSTLVHKGGQALGETNTGEHGLNENKGADYAVDLKPFLSPLGVPCQQPPWGYVAGIDLATGKTMWKHKNGTIRDMTPLPLKITLGMPGIGGPVITASGVAFMAAAVDDYLRAYNLTTGEVVWEGRLPAGGQATPMTYLNSKGEQMVVQVAGGHGSIGTTIGDYVVAYKLAK